MRWRGASCYAATMAVVCTALFVGVCGSAYAKLHPGIARNLPRFAHSRYHRQVCGAAQTRFARCDADLMTSSSGSPLATSGPSGYNPTDLLSAYALASAAATNGTGQTVAIVDAYDDPNAESDLGVYRSQFGLAACTTANGCFRKVNQTGGTSYPSANQGWAEEISLDLDMVSAICPNCHILLVEASSNSDANLYRAENEAATLAATQISNSWSGGEYSGETSDSSTYFNHPSIAITAATGDSGYSAGTQFPASSQYVTAVGGTSLSKASGTSRGWSETAWSGAGSGCSAYITKPSWQTDSGCPKRTEADVSAVADPSTGVSVYDTYGDNGWLVFGGTSVATPIIASYYALVGTGAGDDSAHYVYQHSTWLNDVTAGSTGSCSGSYLCTAETGYDGPTGLGTPNGAAGSISVSQAPQGSWVGTYGGSGYDLLGWSGGADVASMPGVSANVTGGGRYVWAANTSDQRALENAGGTARTASCYYSGGNQMQVQLTFSSAYNGNLELYAVDWDNAGRTETISVGGQNANLSNFSQGAWVTVPINQAANSTLTITITNTGPVNAVLSGIFLGGGGTPPSPPYPSAPQGSWVGTYGGSGYDLLGWSGGADVASMPGVSANVTGGGRYVWAANTSDQRALENAGGTARTASCYYSGGNQMQVQLTFSSAYNGNLELYAVDWDNAGRTETISVGGQNANLSNFSQGAWVTVPINQAANSTLTITITNTGPVNAVLSGIFLGGGGTPPSPPYPSAPQGSWVGTYGGSGYDLLGWSGGADVASMPGVSANVTGGGRYVWAANTSDQRALENAGGTARTASCYYSGGNQMQVQLTFSSAYNGNLELYAVDWDNAGRTETISVGGQNANLSNFSQGAWVTVPINQAANSTLTITITNTGPVNAVLSGIFLG